MWEYLFLSWLDNFVSEKNSKCNLQHDEDKSSEASEPVEQPMNETDSDILNNMDVQDRSSFIEQNNLSTISPEIENASLVEKASLISEATEYPKWVKNKVTNKRQRITEDIPSNSNQEILQKLTDTLTIEEKEESVEDVFGKYVASELKCLNMQQKRIAKSEITNILNHLALEQLDNKMALLDRF